MSDVLKRPEDDEVLIGHKPFNILVCIPAHYKCHSLFTYSLTQMTNLTIAVLGPQHDVGVAMNIGTYVHKSRTELLQAALNADATHVLWVDSDMRFPADALLRLLRHQVPVVGINYAKKDMPPEFVAIKRVPEAEAAEGDYGAFLRTDEKSTGLEEVDAVGFGLVLMETAALADLPDPGKDPWFWYKQTSDGRTIGEDVYFCKYMLQERLGQRIFVDHDLSWECSHIGDFEYRCAHAALAEDDGSVRYQDQPEEAA